MVGYWNGIESYEFVKVMSRYRNDWNDFKMLFYKNSK